MKNLTGFNRENVKEVHNKIDAALKAIGDEYGIHFKTGSIGFNAAEFSFRTTAKILVEGKAPVTTIPGLTAIGTEFIYGGKNYRVVEHKSAPKYNIVAEDIATGTRYKFSNEHVCVIIKK